MFDTYIVIENLVKNSERSRHSQSRAIEISSLARVTPLPVDMGSCWSSSSNKTKLPQQLREQLVDLPSRRCSAELVVIGIGGESAQHCQFELCCCHQTRMCFVLGLFFWKVLDSPLFRIKGTIHGICHCTHFWIRLDGRDASKLEKWGQNTL